MKKHELKELVKEKIKEARGVTDLIKMLDLVSSGGNSKRIKKIIEEEKLDTTHFYKKTEKIRLYPLIDKNCIICNSIFTTKLGHRREQKYCSPTCSNKDRVVSKETLAKLSLITIKQHKFKELEKKYGSNVVGVAFELISKGNRIKEVSEKTLITINDIKILYRIYKSESSDNMYGDIDKKLIKDFYFDCKSIKKTAKHFSCSREYVKKVIDYENLPKPKKVPNSEAVISWRRRRKVELVEYKGGECKCCGYKKSLSVLQFHHIDPNEKDFNIGASTLSVEKLKFGVDKCLLVCANCHLEIHEEMRNNNGVSEKVNNALK